MTDLQQRATRAVQRGGAVVLALCSAVAVTGCADRLPDGHVEQRRLAREVGRAVVLPAAVEVRPGEPSDRMHLGVGWGDGELDAARGERFAWVVGRVAEVTVEHSGSAPATLEVAGWPYWYEGAPEQRLTAVFNGAEADPVVLAPGGFQVEVPVPPGALQAGSNRVELRFDFAEAPSARFDGSSDHRTLAAAVIRLALVAGGADHAPSPAAAVVAEGDDVVVAAGSVAIFRLRVPDGGTLVAEPAPVAVGLPSGDGAAFIRTRNGEGPAGDVVRHGRAVVRLDRHAGAVVDIGLEGGRRGTRWRRPAIWAPAGVPRLPNVVLIVVDTLRADFVGAYGASVATPAMDRLAGRGVLFERAYSHIPITGPSHSSLFTGRLPFEHGVHNNSQILPDDAATLAESMAASGRATAAVVSLGVLRSAFGFGQGFESYGDRFGRDWMKDAAEVNREALAWLAIVGDAPYFLFVHYSDPHEPYAPPTRSYPRIVLRLEDGIVGELAADGRGVSLPLSVPPGASVLRLELDGERPEFGFRFPSIRVAGDDVRVAPLQGWEERDKRFGESVLDTALPATLRLVNRTAATRTVALELSCKEKLGVAAIRQRYAEEVAFVDGRIGELMGELERRGDLPRTLVVLTADHGEGLGDHNHVGHISQLYDTLIRVPFVLSMPGTLPEGVRLPGPAALVDLFPTLAEQLDLEPPEDPHGVSLLPLLDGGVLERPVVAETYRPEAASDKRALVDGGHKYIRSWSDDRDWQELYHLDTDPGEASDLAELDPERLAAMARRLEAILAADGVDPAVPQEAPLTDEEKARLRALGYLRE